MNKAIKYFLVILSCYTYSLAMEIEPEKRVETRTYLELLPDNVRRKIEQYILYERFDQLPFELKEKIVREMIKYAVKEDIIQINDSKTSVFQIETILSTIVKKIKVLCQITGFENIINTYRMTDFIIRLINTNVTDVAVRSNFAIDIHIALLLQNANAIEWLKKNVKKELLNEELFSKLRALDRDGNSIFDYFAIKMLVEAGADVNANDSFSSMKPIQLACSIDIEIVKLLLQHGADIASKTINNRTMLEECIMRCKYKLLQAEDFLALRDIRELDLLGTFGEDMIMQYQNEISKLKAIIEYLESFSL